MAANAKPKKSTSLELLTYGGEVVHMKAERVSLTDMWKAAGRPENRDPAQYLRSVNAERFMEFLSEFLNMGGSHVDLVQVVRGGRAPGTWAHWQIGMNYARYLDPAFAAKCNVAVRERMEGHGGSPASALSLADDERAKSVIGNMIKRCSGVVIRDELAAALPKLLDEVLQRVATDNRNVVTANVSIREVLDQMRVPSRKRRSLQARIYVRLRTHCLLKGIGAVQCVRTKTWLWPVVEATAFIRDSCADLIRQHREAIDRQGRLKLVPSDPKPDGPK